MPTRYRGTQDEVRALNAFITLVRAGDTLNAQLAEDLDAMGLSNSQFGVLEALLHIGPLCQWELGEKLLRSGGNITVVVDNLEKRGLVRRERQKKDRRMITVHLTPEGRRKIASLFPAHAEAVASLMGCLTAPEQETLRYLCRKLGCTVRDAAESGKKGNSHD